MAFAVCALLLFHPMDSPFTSSGPKPLPDLAWLSATNTLVSATTGSRALLAGVQEMICNYVLRQFAVAACSLPTDAPSFPMGVNLRVHRVPIRAALAAKHPTPLHAATRQRPPSTAG